MDRSPTSTTNPDSSTAAPLPGDLFEVPTDPEPGAATANTVGMEPEPEKAPEPPKKSWQEELREVDWEVVRSLWNRELLLTVRSRAWMRLLTWFVFGTALLALLPILYRQAPHHWLTPGGSQWLQVWSLGTAGMVLSAVSGWTRRGISRELRGGGLEEILLTSSGPADILLGKALGAACLTSLLVLAALPSLILATAVGARDAFTLPRLAITLGFCAYLGLCLGMEYSFRKPGTRSTVGRLWSAFYLVMVVGNLARLVNWSWLTAPRRFLVAYNPVSTLLAAGGIKPERWPLGILLFLLLLIFLTLVSFRLLRREWAQAALTADAGSWIRRNLRPQRKDSQELEAVGSRYDNPIQGFEEVFGYRLRVPKWAWITGAVVTALLLLIPKPEVGRFLFSLFFFGACWVAIHNGCAAFSREREAGRWEELALLPLTDREIACGKLAVGVRTWQGLSMAGGASLVAAGVWGRGLDAGLLSWGLISLALVPWGMTRLGGVIGLLTANPDEAQWRTSMISTLVPLLLGLGALTGFQLRPMAAISPAFSALAAIGTGGVTAFGWVGTVTYVLVGWACGWLVATRLRRWAVVMR